MSNARNIITNDISAISFTPFLSLRKTPRECRTTAAVPYKGHVSIKTNVLQAKNKIPRTCSEVLTIKKILRIIKV